jgi:hypothetical protein
VRGAIWAIFICKGLAGLGLPLRSWRPELLARSTLTNS